MTSEIDLRSEALSFCLKAGVESPSPLLIDLIASGMGQGAMEAVRAYVGADEAVVAVESNSF